MANHINYVLLIVFMMFFMIQYEMNSQYLRLLEAASKPQIIYVNQNPVKTAVKISTKQVSCLAEAIYYEGRGETILGQRAIAHVILNRTKAKSFPNTVCGVIHSGCQFTYTCSDKPPITDIEAYDKAKHVAKNVLAGDKDVTYGATYYHAKFVRPKWSYTFDHTVDIGNHKFYKT